MGFDFWPSMASLTSRHPPTARRRRLRRALAERKRKRELENGGPANGPPVNEPPAKRLRTLTPSR